MGEEDGEPRWNLPNSPDKVGLRVASFYKLQSKQGYVREKAMPIPSVQSSVSPKVSRWVTDWDAFTESATDPEAAQAELLAVYGTANVDTNVEYLVYNENWHMRIPVAMARENEYYWFNEVGDLVGPPVSVDGNVMYDSSLSFKHDSSGIDALLELVKVKTPQFDSSVNEQVSTPESHQ